MVSFSSIKKVQMLTELSGWEPVKSYALFSLKCYPFHAASRKKLLSFAKKTAHGSKIYKIQFFSLKSKFPFRKIIYSIAITQLITF